MTRLSSTLETILHVLHQRGMDDVLLREGEPVRLRKGDLLVQVSKDPLARDQIVRMLDQRASGDTSPQVWPTEVTLSDGRRVQVDVSEPSVAPHRLEVVLARRSTDSPNHGLPIDGLPSHSLPSDGMPSVGLPAASAPVAGLATALPTGRSNRAEDAARNGDTAAERTPIAAQPTAESSAPSPAAPSHPLRRASDRIWRAYASRELALADLERLLRNQVQAGAADLHLRVGEPPVLRQRGDLIRMEGELALTDARLTEMVISAMPQRNQVEFAEQSDTDFAHEIEGVSRFRANVLKDRKGTAAVFRTIAATTVTVDEMGISPEVRQLCYLSKGLVLVTGPTGSGKSTTMCALIDLINSTRSDHIITIEDPIEFVHQNKKCLITQRQVGVHTNTFKSALRAALREDPDVVLVGELRDLETVAIAIETAETGHLVFGTLHTATAAGTVDRIIDQFPADRQEQIRVMLAESLKGVVSQTLLKRNGGGRVAAREVMIVNPAISNLIREGKTIQIPSIMQTNKRLGMIMLNDALMDLINAGEVDPLEAYTKAVDKSSLAERLKVKGIDVMAMSRDR